MNRTLEVADLKRTTGILDVLARYGIQAEQKGRQYMARCPFHDDGTPSLPWTRSRTSGTASGATRAAA